MSYIKAEEILPEDLIRRIQQYCDGVSIYIPRREENRRVWGCGTTYRQELRQRNDRIRADAARGEGVKALAGHYHLSEKSIRRILGGRGKNSMQIISYFESENKAALAEKLAAVAWGAAEFLVALLREGRFFEMLGGWGDVYLLMEGENIVSFATLAGQDSVRDESLTPWIGFVYTAPEYRGHRYAGQLLMHLEALAGQKGHRRVYISTDHVGLYEKYGYSFLENRLDYWGDDTRVLYKDL